MDMNLNNRFYIVKLIVILIVFGQTVSIYVPNEIDQASKPYTTGLKIKTSHYKTLSEPYYHSNYSKVFVHNKNYTSSLLDSSGDVSKSSSSSQPIKVYPVYISEEKKEKIKNVLNEHNTNVVDKETLNNRVVYKRRIEKSKNIEVYNKCPTGVTGQFVYDSSCNQYLDCWSGRGSVRNCAPGTLFNPKTLECDFPEKVECLTGPSGNSPSQQRSAKLQTYEQAKCPQSFSGLIPNYTDCTKFIQCNSGIQTPGTCPPGTLFDINLNVCNHPRETKCFSHQPGTSFAVKEQSGGSSDLTGHYQGLYQGQTGHYHGVAGQYDSQSGHYQGQTTYKGQAGQYQGQTGQYQGQTGQYQSGTGQYQGVTGQYQGGTGQYQGGTGQYQGGTGQYQGGTGQYQGGTGQYQGGTEQYQGGTGQYQGGTGKYQGGSGQYQGGTGHFQTQDGYYYQGQPGHYHGQIGLNQGQAGQYENQEGQYSGQNHGQSGLVGQGGQYYGCNIFNLTCTNPTDGQSFGAAGSQQRPTQGSEGTVYIQYVICNPVVEDCVDFQQGTFILGPGGTLCNPLKQNCSTSTQYVPKTKMREPTRSKTLSSGVYYVKYVVCNSLQEDCSKYQKGVVEASYGMSGSGIGVQPVAGGSQGTRSQQAAGCNPLVSNCDAFQYQGQGRPQIPTYNQGSSPQGSLGAICNPQYQKCDQGAESNTGRGFGTHTHGRGYSQTDSQGVYPQKLNSSTNYGNVCNDGDENCYQAGPSTPSQTYGSGKGRNVEPKCPEGFQGITKHPTNCEKFLNCANGITYIQDCGPGTLFNPLILTCDFPYNVDCKNGEEDRTSTPDLDSQQGPYDPIRVLSPPPVSHTTCQGSQCRQGHRVEGQYGGTQNQNRSRQGYSGGYEHGQAGCQGSQCNQGQVGQGQGSYQGQGQLQGQIGEGFGWQQPGHSCQGDSCLYRPQGQGQVYGQGQGQTGVYAGNQQGESGCQGSQCGYTPQGNGSGKCQGNQCQTGQGYQGYTTPTSRVPAPTTCQGHQCGPVQGQTSQGRKPVYGQGQVEDTGDQASLYETTTRRKYVYNQDYNNQGVAGQGSSRNDGGSHIMKIPSQNRHQQGVNPLNKFDRVTSGGFNNQPSIDYVDIFNPDESRNFAYATTTPRSSPKPEKQVWPPPYPDIATTDPDADYVFEYDDGEPVTLAPEKVNTQKRKKTRCGSDDFVCDKKSCVAKSFVCDGVRDCDDGQDEKYCQKYLDEFKVYESSRLDVLEKQRWDNVSYSTCALLCMDSQKFECKSFNYRKFDKTCFLTSENIGSSGGLKNYYPCDYYERKGTSMDCRNMHKCPNGKCLTSDEVCDGYDDCGDRADERGCRADDFGYQVRLAGGEEASEGRVEVTVFGKTGYICDDQFSITDANVLCKELGFYLGAAEVKGNSFYAKELKENHTLYMMDDIECLGNESSLMHCSFAGWGIHNCADKEIAGVVCKTPEETCTEGFWKCDTGNECVKLPFLCDDLDDCTDNSDEASHHCNSPTELRLVNGTRTNEGRLEVSHHGIWGSVCDDDFNEDAAKIVCRTLGYSGSAYVKKDAYFGESKGPIWLDQVSCYGNESSLEKCSHWEWGSHNCDHSEDVGVVCSNVLQEVDAQRNSKNIGSGVSGSITNAGTGYPSPEPVSCGYRKDNIFLAGDDVHFRVVQGSLAKSGDYPWQAALRINGQDKTAHWCGAVVIASRWVLTAAHCLEGYPKGAYVIVAGEYNMDEDEGTEQQVFIEEYYIHEHFRQGHKMGNDIALIKLKGNGFKLNQDIQPICLPDESSDYERELNCTISGFGTVQTGKSAYSHKLRAAWIPVQKMDVCKMAHIYGENIGPGMICAGDLNGGGDACDGDSGGPLACLEDGVFTLYGLTSWGQRCGYANKPGVYVKVSHYKKWIERIMKLHS